MKRKSAYLNNSTHN